METKKSVIDRLKEFKEKLDKMNDDEIFELLAKHKTSETENSKYAKLENYIMSSGEKNASKKT